MSQLFAIVYETPEAARTAADRLRDLARGKTISINDLVIVRREADGRIDLEQSINLVTGGALGGAFWGGLVGLLFLAPVAGVVGGAAAGALAGWLSDYGIDDAFMKSISEQVTPGKAALFVLADQLTPEKVAPVLGLQKGDLLYSSLSAEVDAILKAALAQAGGSGEPVAPVESEPAQSQPVEPA